MYYKKRIALLLAMFMLAVSVYGCASHGSYGTSPAATTNSTIAADPTMTTNPPPAPFDPKSMWGELSEDIQNDVYAYFQIYGEYEASLSFRIFGAFEDVYVLMLDEKLEYAPVPCSETVNGLTFYYPTGQTLMLFAPEYGRMHYHLPEAFTLQLITEEELAVVYENYYSAYPHFLPQAEAATPFTDSTKKEISDIWLTQYGETLVAWDNINLDRRASVSHYVTFDSKHVFFWFDDLPFVAGSASVTVGEYTFESYYSQFQIYVYEDGVLMTLTEAYELGHITDDQLWVIWTYDYIR